MKIIFKIVLIFLLLYKHVESSNNNFRVQLNSRNSISVALTNVIDEFFIKQEILFDVVFVVPYSKNYPDIFDLTLTKIKNNRPISVKKFYPENYVKNFLNLSSIIFIDWSIHVNLNLSKFFTVSKVDPRGLRFVLYYQNCSDVTAKNTTFNDDSSTFPITLYSFIICHQDENTLNLVTHEWFEPGKCNQRQIKILNSFNLETKTWKNPLKNYQKFKNFNGCYFEILDLHDDPLFNVFTVPLKNTSIISSIARKTNFTFDFVNRSYVTTEIFFQPGYLVLYDKYATTTSYSELKIGLIVTEGEAYSDYEKLLLPFDESTWTLLLGTFAFAFMLIFCLNRMRIQIREIFYGKGVTMPSFNVVGTFFGIGQTRLPEANFSRFILMMFIIFCLIFRTAYQGVLFEFMNTDMRKPHAKTIDEVFEKNFTIFVHPSPDAQLLYTYLEVEKQKIMKIKGIEGTNLQKDICKIIIENKPKTAIVVGDVLLMIVNSICEKKPIKIQETYMTIPVGLATESLHFMFENIEDTIQWLIPSGIIKQSEDFYYWVLYGKNHFEIDDGPKILAISDLSYGFNIWLITCLATIFEFFMEIFVHRMKCHNEIKISYKESIEKNKKIDIDKRPSKNFKNESTKCHKCSEKNISKNSNSLIITKENRKDLKTNKNLENMNKEDSKIHKQINEEKRNKNLDKQEKKFKIVDLENDEERKRK